MLVAQVINLLYSIVDRIYIGRIPGEGTAALGGIGLCFPIITLVTAFTNLYGSGGSPLCAIARGQKDTARAEKIVNTAFRLLVITAVIITVIGLAFGEPLLYLFGASDTSIVYALPYLNIYILGTIFAMISTGMNAYINAQGFSQTGMFTVLIGAAANIILDPIFIFILGMGIRGAALATIISQGLSAAFVVRFLAGRTSNAELKVHISRHDFAPDPEISKSIVELGLAAFIMQFTNSVVTIVCNKMLMITGGELFVSVMTIIASVRQVLDTPILAISDGTTPVLSYNYGARRPDRVRKSIAIMTAMCFIYTLVIVVLIQIIPHVFISVFTSDESLISEAVPAMHLYFFAFLFQSLQYSGQTTFKALNKKKKAIFFSLFRKVVMVVPLTMLLPVAFGLGSDGVFIAEPISNFIGGSASFTTMLLTVLPELKRIDAENEKA